MAAAISMRGVSYRLRPSGPADDGFLLELYAQTRAGERMLSGMDALQWELFLQMQFRLRQASYRTTYPMAVDEIICVGSGVAMGRVLTYRAADGMYLVDIAIVREKQRQGFGTQVIQDLQHECAEQGWEMRLQVLKGSPAEDLYQRLGFRATSEDQLRRQMVWDRMKI
jgi:N-acetylglutamate synthase-like GNAT family acetyltransferase